mgnify:CR=1 FL=1
MIRSQYKTPIEHFVGALRGLDARGGGRTLSYLDHAHRPPRVLPAVGHQLLPARPEGALINAAYVATRDAGADIIANGYVDEPPRRVLGRTPA